MKIHLTAEQVIGLRDHLKKSMSSSGANDPTLVEIFDLLTKNITAAIAGQDKPVNVTKQAYVNIDVSESAVKQALGRSIPEPPQRPTLEAMPPGPERDAMARAWKIIEEREQEKIDNLQRQLEAMRRDRDFMVPDEEDKFDDFGYPRKGWKRPPPPFFQHKGKRKGHLK